MTTIAIDGPSGAGKGTVARAVARALGFRHIDTGAMYRAVGWLALTRGLSLEDEGSLATLAANAHFELDQDHVAVDGHDVTRAIRTPEIDRAATAVARLPRVREALVAQQRRLGQGGGVVMEGRDIGTVVFPAADVKIYLDASPEERARRRASDPAHAGSAGGVTNVAGALAERDRLDRTRAASPLMVAADADVLDTTGLSIEEVVSRALALIERRTGIATAGWPRTAKG
jgi:cytidylate kinase